VLVYGEGSHAVFGVGGGPGTGTATITGNVFLLADESKHSDFQVDAGGSVTVTGAFNVLSSEGLSQINVTSVGPTASGGSLTVNGLFAMLGNKIDTRIWSGGELDVVGMMVLATPTSNALQRFWVDSGGEMDATFHNTNLETEVANLTDALGDTFELPPAAYGGYELATYVEQNFSAALAEQDALIATKPAEGLGLDALDAVDEEEEREEEPVEEEKPVEEETPVEEEPAEETPVDEEPVEEEKPVEEVPSEPDPSEDPYWNEELGIILDSEALLNANQPCHCGAMDGRSKYKYKNHHGLKF
jgi:hypothetical protein